jgi:hypothetical protein
MFTEPNISPVERACVARTDPGHLIGDNAYDSDKLAAQLRYYGIELVAPHRSNRRIKTQTNVFEAIPSTLENRKTICLAAEFSAPGRAV